METDMPKANIIFIPGLYNSDWQIKLGESLVQKNFKCHFFNMIGFGFSGGQRYNPSESEIFEAFSQVIAQVERILPLFVIAENFGATFFLKLNGIVLIQPWIKIPNSFFFYNNFITKIILFITEKFMGDLLIKNYLCEHNLVPDLESLHDYYSKGMSIPFFGLRFVSDIYNACSNLKSLTVPMLMLTSKDDPVINSNDCFKFLENSSTDHSQYKEMKSGKHCLLKSKRVDQVESIIQQWLKEIYNPKLNLCKVRILKKKNFMTLLLYLKGLQK